MSVTYVAVSLLLGRYRLLVKATVISVSAGCVANVDALDYALNRRSWVLACLWISIRTLFFSVFWPRGEKEWVRCGWGGSFCGLFHVMFFGHARVRWLYQYVRLC